MALRVFTEEEKLARRLGRSARMAAATRLKNRYPQEYTVLRAQFPAEKARQRLKDAHRAEYQELVEEERAARGRGRVELPADDVLLQEYLDGASLEALSKKYHHRHQDIRAHLPAEVIRRPGGQPKHEWGCWLKDGGE